ncbi:MAG: hypothetical protein R3B11_08905 [Nitrospira sp.]|nr:hypothetical protein [Nitrospira sp.]
MLLKTGGTSLRDLLIGVQDPPEQAKLYKALGEALIKVYPSQPLLAIACYEKALLINPADTDLRFEIAYTHSKVITTAGSFYHYRKLIEVKPEHDAAQNNAGWTAEELSLPLTSVDYYKVAAKQDNTLAMSNLGRLLLQSGFEQEAREALEKARKQPHPHPNVDQWLGQIQKDRRGEQTKIEELDERIKMVLHWRKAEAEAIAQKQIPREKFFGSYTDSTGNVLTITSADAVMLHGEMTKTNETFSLSGNIYGSLLAFSWKTTPSANAPSPTRSLLSIAYGTSG